MGDSPRLIERAFELARSGAVPNVDQLRLQLKGERFGSVDQHIAGSLVKQLRAAITASKAEAA